MRPHLALKQAWKNFFLYIIQDNIFAFLQPFHANLPPILIATSLPCFFPTLLDIQSGAPFAALARPRAFQSVLPTLEL